MRFSVVLASLAVLMLPAGAMAQVNTITANPDSKTETKSVMADGRVCKKRIVLGSRMPTRKVCRTQAEWDAEAKHAKDELDTIQRSGGLRNCMIGPNGVCIQS